jgi:hypothetical protein
VAVAFVTGILAGAAILLLIGPWLTTEVAGELGTAGLLLTAVGSVIAAIAISWVPVALGSVIAVAGYAWLVRCAHRDRRRLLLFLERQTTFAHGLAWCLGLVGGPDPYSTEMATVVGSHEVGAEVRPHVVPTARRQARLSWAVRNAWWFYRTERRPALRPRPFPF